MPNNILHIPASEFGIQRDPLFLGDSIDDDETAMLEIQEWFDQRAPDVFQVVALDYPGDDEPKTTYPISALSFSLP